MQPRKIYHGLTSKKMIGNELYAYRYTELGLGMQLHSGGTTAVINKVVMHPGGQPHSIESLIVE